MYIWFGKLISLVKFALEENNLSAFLAGYEDFLGSNLVNLRPLWKLYFRKYKKNIVALRFFSIEYVLILCTSSNF